MGTRGVVPLKLVVDPGRGIQGLLQLVSPNQRGRAVHLIDVLNGFRNIHIGGGAIQLLAGKLRLHPRAGGYRGGAEDRAARPWRSAG